jgi:hypothetical protein
MLFKVNITLLGFSRIIYKFATSFSFPENFHPFFEMGSESEPIL